MPLAAAIDDDGKAFSFENAAAALPGYRLTIVREPVEHNTFQLLPLGYKIGWKSKVR